MAHKMKFNLPVKVNSILNTLQKRGHQAHIVGGAVRDLLMKKRVKNWDFTTDAKPEEILKLFPNGFYDNKFGTVGVPINGQVFEITTMRKEGDYKDFRHPTEVAWTDKLEKDLARRDLTINAIALLSNGQIVDPFNGQGDLNQKRVKAVGDPSKRFQEDALRLIRAVRIATELGFEIETNTLLAIKQNAHLLKEVAWERIRDEVFKILQSESPDKGILLLRQTGLLKTILPEVERCFGVTQKGPKRVRVYDIGEHSTQTLKHTPSKDPIVKLAALLHDIGKPNTHSLDSAGNVTFYQHDVVGGRLAQDIAKRFNLSGQQTDKLIRLVRWHLFTVEASQTDSALRRFIKNVGAENLEDMFALREGDRLGGGTQRPTSWRLEKFKSRIKKLLKKPFTPKDLKVDGYDVMKQLKITPGRKVGEVLTKLFEEVLGDASKNNREYLLKRIKQLS